MGDRIMREKTYIYSGQQVTIRRDLKRNGSGIRVSVVCKDANTQETLWNEHKDYTVVAAGDWKFFQLCRQYGRGSSATHPG